MSSEISIAAITRKVPNMSVRSHVLIDNRGVRRRKKQETEHDTDEETECVTQRRAERARDEDLAHVTQHIIAHAFRAGCVDVAVDDLQSAERMHGESKQRGEQTNLDHDDQDRRRGCSNDTGILFATASIEFHHAGGIGDGFDSRKGKYDADETGPVLSKRSVQWLQVTERRTEMWQAEKAEHNDNDCGGNGNQERESTCLFRSEQVK